MRLIDYLHFQPTTFHLSSNRGLSSNESLLKLENSSGSSNLNSNTINSNDLSRPFKINFKNIYIKTMNCLFVFYFNSNIPNIITKLVMTNYFIYKNIVGLVYTYLNYFDPIYGLLLA